MTLPRKMSVGHHLDALRNRFERNERILDPVFRVHEFSDPADQEIVGFFSAALAYGRVAGFLRTIDALLAMMGPSPAAFVRRFDPERDASGIVTLKHRWTRGIDLVALIWIARRMLEKSGSLEGFFLEAYSCEAEDVTSALESFSSRALSFEHDFVYGSDEPTGVLYFFPRPSRGSGCKRLNLFLRWMVRQGGIDLGIWRRVDAAKLIVPLDTHVIRVSQCLRLTKYKSPGWAMALEITKSLRKLDPSDPVKYDFTLCHLGMLEKCGFERPHRDTRCPLRGLCQPRFRRRR